MVNWDKPMLGQVASLGAQYERWVNFPVERNLRLFGPSYLEELTKSRWYFVPIVWVPVTIAFLVMHLQANHSVFMAVLGLVLGLLNWTLLEYSLHRWVFHLTPGNNPFLITAHFLLHGLHHKVPFDGRRLVFPPVPAGILCVVLYSAYSKVLPLYLLDSMAAGTVIGYICYDLTHYYLHFGTPKPQTHMYNMKRYHNRHHFSHHDQGYGITSALWDQVFGTAIVLHKLAKAIKW
ncbi:hypothetical protein B566_EDAN005444 [Ephemera danica]|nr:hypothetical protein B566_EDAN005444 [Ephemera danica]